MSRLDIIIFGASGYTGTFVVRELAKIFSNEKLTWAIAGRSINRLKSVLDSVSNEEKIDLSKIEIIVADVNDQNSIKQMCDRGNIIINCVGPYRFYGEQIIKQCIESKSHHLDISGEPEYLEKMQLKYSEDAYKNRVYIVGSCGFDSVPADLGLIYTQKNFANDLSYVESFMLFDSGKTVTGKPAATFNYTTWECAVYGFSSINSLIKTRKELFKSRLPKPEHQVPKRFNFLGYFYDQMVRKYCMLFPGSDKSVVQRTQYFNYEALNKRPVQYVPYFTINSGFRTAMVIVYGLVFSFLAKYNFGRKLLLKHYGLFSAGLASKKQTTYEEMKDVKFKFIFRGVGYSNRLENKNEQHTEKPSKTIITEINGPEPGYISTARIVLSCALSIMNERDKMPKQGGVFTPGAAFGNTSLIERLEKCDIHFKVVRNDSV